MSKGNSGLFIGTKGGKQDNQASKPLLNPNLSKEKNDLIQKVKDQGYKIFPDKVLDIGTMANGKIVWIELGTLAGKPSGLAHILEHEVEFKNVGILKENIPSFIINVVTKGKHVGYQGNGPTPRDVFKAQINNKDIYLAVTISSNGYIVGANITKISKFKED